MPEEQSGGNSSPNPPKEMSMEVRLLLAFLLMGVVMFVTPYFFKTPPAPPSKKAPQTTAAPAAANQPPPSSEKTEAPAAVAAAESTAASGPVTKSQPQPPFVIDTDLYRIALSNQGATVRSWVLKKYKGNDGKPLEVTNTAAGSHPFALFFPAEKPTSDVNWAWFQPTGDPDGLGVTYEFSDGHTTVKKVFRFTKNSYLSQISTEATLDGKPLAHMIEWRNGFGDLTVKNAAGSQRALYFNVTDNKLIEKNAGSAKSGPLTAAGNFSFAGIADSYFAAAFLPRGNIPESMQQVTFADSTATELEKTPAVYAGTAVSEGAANRFDLFLGPKDVDLLKRINPKLEQVVDFGWLSVLAKPLFLVVNWFNDAFVHNFGWSIVVVTLVINLALFPLKLSNMKSMRKMQALKPQIDAINAKYKNLKLTDPKKADQNQEVMDLYKKHSVNPMGGCFPMLLQLPFFFAFYKVFTVSVEMRGASWLWVSDLSQPEHLAIKILPIAMIASQFLMQNMTPQANMDPNQARMMKFMPLLFGFMFYQFPSGLVLYYLTSNLVSMGQQWFFNHTDIAQQAASSVEPPKKKNGRK